MSTLRDDLLGVVDDARSISAEMGLHQVAVSIVTRTWSSGRVQTGIATISTLVLVPTPHVVGTSGDPEITVGAITPFYSDGYGTGGYTPAQLNPSQVSGVEYYYLVQFNDGISRPYMVQPRGLNTDRAMRYMVRLRSLDLAVPF